MNSSGLMADSARSANTIEHGDYDGHSDPIAGTRPGFVLAACDYPGGLAAIRSLGSAGVPVHVMDRPLLTRGRWSKWASTCTSCPSPASDGRLFVERLIGIGKRFPGSVLYPTNDDNAFLFGIFRDELESQFALFQPKVEVVYALLNKRHLYDLAGQVGLEMPESWFPASVEDLPVDVRGVRFPLVIKPQTQIQYVSKSKGIFVRERGDLPGAFERFGAEARFGREVLEYDPHVATPVIQRYLNEASEKIYSLAGFMDADGNASFRASNKILQRPRRLGMGVCFEAVEVERELAEALENLLRRVGYFGVFEAEFIHSRGRHFLIDMNPRFYGEMGFEVARGLPMAQLVYEAALGRAARVKEALEAASRCNGSGPTAYCHRTVFDLILSNPFAGRMGKEERKRWRDWYGSHEVVDAIRSPNDAMPGIIDALMEIYSGLRHPRGFIRSLAGAPPSPD